MSAKITNTSLLLRAKSCDSQIFLLAMNSRYTVASGLATLSMQKYLKEKIYYRLDSAYNKCKQKSIQ